MRGAETMTDHLLVEKRDGIATLVMNRPDIRNALSLEMQEAILVALKDIELDPDIRCVVFQGAGEHFMAGGDITSFMDIVDKPADERRQTFEGMVHVLNPLLLTLRRMSKPTIASVRGGAAGFGLCLVMACDLAIAADDAFFTLAYINIGATPDGSGTYMLPRIVGMKKAMEIALLGDRIGAAEACDLGLINRVVPAGDLVAETDKLATRLANGPTVALGLTKQLLNASLANSHEAQLAEEARGFAACAATDDWVEGITAFLDKRRPVFTGK